MIVALIILDVCIKILICLGILAIVMLGWTWYMKKKG